MVGREEPSKGILSARWYAAVWTTKTDLWELYSQPHFHTQTVNMELVLVEHTDRTLGVHGSVHRSINLIERTNKMRQCSRIYYSNVS